MLSVVAFNMLIGVLKQIYKNRVKNHYIDISGLKYEFYQT